MEPVFVPRAPDAREEDFTEMPSAARDGLALTTMRNVPMEGMLRSVEVYQGPLGRDSSGPRRGLH